MYAPHYWRVLTILLAIVMHTQYNRETETSAEEVKSGSEDPHLDEFREIEEAKDDIEYRLEMASALSSPTLDRLGRLKHHGNWGMATQAAWTIWVDDRRRFQGPFEISRVREGAIRWTGFLEGRLGVSSPENWRLTVESAVPRGVHPVLNPNPAHMVPFFFKSPGDAKKDRVEILPGLKAFKDVSATERCAMKLSF